MAQRTCDIDGCDRKHLARGMCGTHYNKARYPEDVRHPKRQYPCAVCGTLVARRVDKAHLYVTTCSVPCRTIVQWGGEVAQPDTYEWRTDAVRRARRYGAPVIEEFDREQIFDRDDWTCGHCGIRCTQPDPFVVTSATVDHVVPLSRGGEHSQANTQTLCLSCNSRKATEDRAA